MLLHQNMLDLSIVPQWVPQWPEPVGIPVGVIVVVILVLYRKPLSIWIRRITTVKARFLGGEVEIGATPP